MSTITNNSSPVITPTPAQLTPAIDNIGKIAIVSSLALGALVTNSWSVMEGVFVAGTGSCMTCLLWGAASALQNQKMKAAQLIGLGVVVVGYSNALLQRRHALVAQNTALSRRNEVLENQQVVMEAQIEKNLADWGDCKDALVATRNNSTEACNEALAAKETQCLGSMKIVHENALAASDETTTRLLDRCDLMADRAVEAIENCKVDLPRIGLIGVVAGLFTTGLAYAVDCFVNRRFFR